VPADAARSLESTPAPIRFRRLKRAFRISAIGLTTVALMLAAGSCAIRPPAANSLTLQSRIDTLNTSIASAATSNFAPLTIYWSEHQVPFIEAADDRDVPYAMGLVHMHLRRGQMDLLRAVSQGRLAEAGVPLGIVVDIDHALRTLDLGKAAPQVEADMKPSTKAWLDRYVQGLNDARKASSRTVPEDRILNLPSEPWTARDIITLGRLASADINWGSFISLLTQSAEPQQQAIRQRLRKHHDQGSASFGGPDAKAVTDLLQAISKSGSNSFVLAPSRTTSGKAMVANDPHVGFNLPALWCAVSYQSPSFNAAGLTIPGLPMILLGRNQNIAWGGTNMQGISSALVDVSSVPTSEITTSQITIARRWLPDVKRDVRQSPFGPIISDLPLLKDWKGPPVALKWRGHQSSDEFTGFLEASHAANWEQFRQAFARFAVSGQNITFADTAGNIGQLLAFEFNPAASRSAIHGIADPSKPEFTWSQSLGSLDLPFAYNPPEGFLVSTNNVPVKIDPPVVLNGNWNDRQLRITALIEKAPVDRVRAGVIQRDVYSQMSHDLAQAFTKSLTQLPPFTPKQQATLEPIVDDLRKWDGYYLATSRGALVFQIFTKQVIDLAFTRLYGKKLAGSLADSSALYALLREDVEAGLIKPEEFTQALTLTANKLRKNRWKQWGDIHQLQLAHPLANIPVLGDWYKFGQMPVDGSLMTVAKSAAPVSDEPHTTRYGANARQIIDFTDVDDHFFAIVGGQDGWMGSQNFLDLTPMWREGNLVRLPLRAQTARKAAVATTTIPAPSTPTP
jgi:penicillin G amidase